MKELITRIEELAVQVAGAQLQIDKSEAESRELGRELGKARQKMMELVNERDHALARVPTESWAEENKRLAAQSEDLLGVLERRELLIKSLNDEITKRDHELRAHEKELAEQRLEREQMQHQIAELRTECDRIREISKSLVPKSALKQAVQEAAELHAEVAKLAEENKKLVAQTEDSEVTERRERLIKSLNDEITKRDHELRAHEKELAEQREEIRKLMDGHAEDMKAQAELLSKYESLLTKITDLGSYAMTIGRKEGEPLEMFMERQALRLAAYETKIELRPIENRIGHFAVICTKCDELDRAKTERADAMEHCIQLRAESESLRAELQGYRAGESEAMEAAKANGIQAFEKLGGFIWRQSASLRQAQAANAPLNKLYFTMRKHRDDCNISANAEPIYRAVNEASDAIKKLTA